MSATDCPIQQLIELKQRERQEAQAAHLREVVDQVEAQLGPRAMAAIEQTSSAGWEFTEGQAGRWFKFGGDDFAISIFSSEGPTHVTQVELRLKARDIRDEDCRKRSEAGVVDEDWFVDAIRFICDEASIIRRR